MGMMLDQDIGFVEAFVEETDQKIDPMQFSVVAFYADANGFECLADEAEWIVRKFYDDKENLIFETFTDQKTLEEYLAEHKVESAEHYKCPMNTVKAGSCECPKDAAPHNKYAPDRNYRGLGFDAPSKLSGDMQSPDIKELNAILEESNTVKDADQDIKDAVGKYTNGEFHYVNNLLYGAEDELKRQGVEDQKIIETRELVTKLDKIFETSELKHDIVTYRGIGGYAYSKMTDEVRNALQTPGSEIEFPAFLSTSVRSDYAVSFSDVGSPNSIVFEMRLPQGTKATYVATESAFPREMEMLVNRGTRFKVVSEPRIEAISLGRDKFSGDAQPIRTKVITLEALT